jgi:hypothetical protein
MDHGTIELVCIAVIAGAVLIQTIILIGFVVGVAKTAKAIKEEVDEMRSTVMPVVKSTGELLVRLGPKVESTVTDVSELTRLVRTQAAEAQVAVEEILHSVRKQTTRMDTMLSDSLDAVDKATAFATKAVSVPVRQLSGILAAIKATIESLGSSKVPPRQHDSQEESDTSL